MGGPRRIIRWRKRAAKEGIRKAGGRFIAECRAAGHLGSGDRGGKEKARPSNTGIEALHPFHQGISGPAGLHRQLRADGIRPPGAHLRLPRRTTSAIPLDFARKYGFNVMAVVLPGGTRNPKTFAVGRPSPIR